MRARNRIERVAVFDGDGLRHARLLLAAAGGKTGSAFTKLARDMGGGASATTSGPEAILEDEAVATGGGRLSDSRPWRSILGVETWDVVVTPCPVAIAGREVALRRARNLARAAPILSLLLLASSLVSAPAS